MKRLLSILSAVFLLGGVVAAGVAVVFAIQFGIFLSFPHGPAAPVVISIETGSPLAETAAQLEREGVVTSAFNLELLARLRGAATKVQAGEYEFGEPAKPEIVLARLVSGDVRRYRFTIPEGLNLREIAARVEAAGIGDAQNFLRLALDPLFIGSLGITASTLEGYLFPETYTYYQGTSQERLIESMVRQFSGRLSAELLERTTAIGLNTHQLVTLASIIQKEAGNVGEMPLVSAVFHNRLRLGMPLQADPTVTYGLEDFDGRITRKHLRADTPYNTYRISGLPPGPIANPGEAALRAAAYPAKVDYLFFVARGDGTHVFSRTLKEHNTAVQEYRRLQRKP